MSGSNPFRRRGPAADAIPQRDGDGRPPVDDAGTASKPPDARTAPAPRPQKTVRIASPPVPPSSSPPPRRASSTSIGQYTTFKGQPIRHRGSPPPPSQDSDPAVENDDAVDPFNLDADASGSEDEGSGHLENSVEWKSNSSGPDLASQRLEQRLGDGQHGEESHQRVDWSNAAASAATSPPSSGASKRATMDVDAFKRLLLTGDTGTASGPDLSTAVTETAGNGSSRTGLGARSEQEIPESQPRHEQDVPNAASAQTGTKGKTKPPPPKTRHGKLIRSSDEAATATADSVPSQPPSILPPTPWTSTPSVQESNKPLPQTASETSGHTTAHEQSHTSANPSSKPTKRPPTPPLARRRSQMTHESPGVSRSDSTRLSVNANKTNVSNLSRTPSTHKTPPPPPSSRRIDTESTESSSPSISSKQRLSHIEDPPGKTLSSENDSSENSSLHRSNSGSIKGFSTTPRKPHAPNVPPKPPPPRRTWGSTNRASLDEPRPNITLSSEESAVTGNAREREAMEPANEPSNANEILADLSQLQREVDDLRGQYETRKPSG